MKKKLIILTLTLFVGVVSSLTLSKVENTSSQIDLYRLIIHNAAAGGEYSSEGCKFKMYYSCFADDGSVWLNCQERVLFNGDCN